MVVVTWLQCSGGQMVGIDGDREMASSKQTLKWWSGRALIRMPSKSGLGLLIFCQTCWIIERSRTCLETVFARVCGRDCCRADSSPSRLAAMWGLADNDALQFILLGIVIVISNGMLVPLNCSHAARQQSRNITSRWKAQLAINWFIPPLNYRMLKIYKNISTINPNESSF